MAIVLGIAEITSRGAAAYDEKKPGAILAPGTQTLHVYSQGLAPSIESNYLTSYISTAYSLLYLFLIS